MVKGIDMSSSSPANEKKPKGGYSGPEVIIPDDSFLAKALPGFKMSLEARRSIRIYDDSQIPERIMKDCLKDATLAPSSSNLQPYELYWVRQPEKKSRLQAACLGQPAATTAAELIIVAARRDLWKTNLKKLKNIMTKGGKTELRGAVGKYYNQLLPKVMSNDPFGVFNKLRLVGFTTMGLSKPIIRAPISDSDHRVWAHTQAALAAQTLMLSLAAHGYDSCPMGGIDEVRIKKIIGLPAQAEVSMVISAGRRKPEGLYSRRVRLEDDDLIKIID